LTTTARRINNLLLTAIMEIPWMLCD